MTNREALARNAPGGLSPNEIVLKVEWILDGGVYDLNDTEVQMMQYMIGALQSALEARYEPVQSTARRACIDGLWDSEWRTIDREQAA